MTLTIYGFYCRGLTACNDGTNEREREDNDKTLSTRQRLHSFMHYIQDFTILYRYIQYCIHISKFIYIIYLYI